MPDERSTESPRPGSRPGSRSASLTHPERASGEHDRDREHGADDEHEPEQEQEQEQEPEPEREHEQEQEPEQDHDHEHDHTEKNEENEENEENENDENDHDHTDGGETDDVPVEALVEHLLAARRALGTIGQVLRSNELATEARRLHAQAAADLAEAVFLRRGLRAQAMLLQQVRAGMGSAYDAGQRDFEQLLQTLDAAGGQLAHTMDILRATTVASVFRPADEAPRSLLDFVDETGVAGLQDALKSSIGALQATQASFDGDLLRFDTDLRGLSRAMGAAAPLPPAVDSSVLVSLAGRAQTMAENLASLTRHFDLCVTAVRSTEGGLAMARFKAHEPGQGDDDGGARNDDDGVSLSGVLAKQQAAGADVLDPISAQERAEMVQVVLADAAEVGAVVADMGSELAAAEAEFATVHAYATAAETARVSTHNVLLVVDDVGSRLRSYAEAEGEFRARWGLEKAAVAERLADMDALRVFYEGYLNAYDTLLLEAERRRAVDARIAAVWRKARDTVARLAEADRGEREAFRAEVGAFLPTDLWHDMDRVPPGVERLPEGTPVDKKTAPGRTQRAERTDQSGSVDAGSAETSRVGGSSTRTVRGR